MPLNILFLLNSFNTGGFEQLTLEIVRRLHGDGMRFRMLCLKEGGNLVPEIEKIGVEVGSGFLQHKYDLAGFFKIRRALSGEKIDILFLEPGRNALLAGEFLNRSLPIDRRISAIHSTGTWGQKHMFRSGEKRMLRALDGVITCAAIQKEYLITEEGVSPGNLTVIFNGVDPVKFQPLDRENPPPLPEGLSPGGKSVGIVASLTPEKGHEVFVDAAALTLDQVPDTCFYIIGTGPEQGKIEEQIVRKGLAGRVFLLGRRRDLPALLPRLDLLALSSHPYRETLPISTMEGMACGLPTVNTEVGSVRDLVVDGETGILVPPGDPKAMAGAFTRVLMEPGLARSMGRKGRERIEERFTLDRTVKEYRDFFHAVAEVNGKTS